jgi:hypothetical protein
MYEDKIRELEQEFERISTKLNEMQIKNNTHSDEFPILNKTRSRIFDEIRRLRRLQWDEEHEQLGWDE